MDRIAAILAQYENIPTLAMADHIENLRWRDRSAVERLFNSLGPRLNNYPRFWSGMLRDGTFNKRHDVIEVIAAGSPASFAAVQRDVRKSWRENSAFLETPYRVMRQYTLAGTDIPFTVPLTEHIDTWRLEAPRYFGLRRTPVYLTLRTRNL